MTAPAASITVAAPALCATALAMAAMATVACRDMRTFEIDPEPLLVATLAALAAVAAVEGLHGVQGSLAAAAVCWAVAWGVARLRPGRIGRGDVWLFGAMGAVAGTELLPRLLALFAMLTMAAAVMYSLARGRRLFRTMVPAAPPGMAAAAMVLAVRVAEQLVGGAPRDVDLPQPGLNALSVPLLLAALGVAVRAGLLTLRGARR